PSDEQTRLMDLIRNIQPHVPLAKLCVSSCPEPLLRKKLENVPSFRIHELTELDIWNYTSNFVRLNLQPLLGASTRDFIDAVCERAEGVFLWVALTLRSLERGLQMGDNPAELHNRLRALPSGLLELYKTMWARLSDDKEIYRQEAARYLNFVLTWQFTSPYESLTILEMLLILNPALRNDVSADDLEFGLFPSKFNSHSDELISRLETRCGCLVEVGPGRRTGVAPSSVKLIHRSVKEFLEESTEGRNLMTSDTSTKFDRIASIFSVLMEIRLLEGYTETKLPHEDRNRMTRNPDFFLGLI
ncbi:hypothetical protein QBC35DRAFT_383963, partial [Podospora australis]